MYKQLLEKPFFFNLWSSIYVPTVAEQIRTVISDATRASILDLGCGLGHMSAYLPLHDYVGIEQNRTYIEYAKKRFKGTFITGNITKLAHYIAPREFDYVLIVGVLHHMDFADGKSLMEQLTSYLHPHGRIILIDHVYRDDLSFINKVLLQCDRGTLLLRDAEYRLLFEGFTVLSRQDFDITVASIPLWSSLARFVLTKP